MYVVTHPDRVHLHRATHNGHKAFIEVHPGQQVTSMSPPIWALADQTRLVGLWCLMVTTYNTDPNYIIIMTQQVNTGLVPMRVLTRKDKQ